ncbi:hypothetical protein ACOMHN_031486 [Nucella lapillus]
MLKGRVAVSAVALPDRLGEARRGWVYTHQHSVLSKAPWSVSLQGPVLPPHKAPQPPVCCWNTSIESPSSISS